MRMLRLRTRMKNHEKYKDYLFTFWHTCTRTELSLEIWRGPYRALTSTPPLPYDKS